MRGSDRARGSGIAQVAPDRTGARAGHPRVTAQPRHRRPHRAAEPALPRHTLRPVPAGRGERHRTPAAVARRHGRLPDVRRDRPGDGERAEPRRGESTARRYPVRLHPDLVCDSQPFCRGTMASCERGEGVLAGGDDATRPAIALGNAGSASGAMEKGQGAGAPRHCRDSRRRVLDSLSAARRCAKARGAVCARISAANRTRCRPRARRANQPHGARREDAAGARGSPRVLRQGARSDRGARGGVSRSAADLPETGPCSASRSRCRSTRAPAPHFCASGRLAFLAEA